MNDDFWSKLQEKDLPDNLATYEEDFWDRVKESTWDPAIGTISNRSIENINIKPASDKDLELFGIKKQKKKKKEKDLTRDDLLKEGL